MDNGGVGRFADGRCPGHRSNVHRKRDGGEGPLEPGFIEPECSNICRGEEHRLYQEPRTKYRVPFTGYEPEAPPCQIRAASPSPLPAFVNVSSHKRADGNRESSTSWLMMLHVALSAYGEYVWVHGYISTYIYIHTWLATLVTPFLSPYFVCWSLAYSPSQRPALPMFLFCVWIGYGIVGIYNLYFFSVKILKKITILNGFDCKNWKLLYLGF